VIGATTGVAASAGSGEALDDLVRDADAAMYRAKADRPTA
jgi:PleD family two-component response regulator